MHAAFNSIRRIEDEENLMPPIAFSHAWRFCIEILAAKPVEHRMTLLRRGRIADRLSAWNIYSGMYF